MPSLSVIIPTHKRAHILKLCLQHLETQTIADELEVIVVSDGPDPETAKLFEPPTSYPSASLPSAPLRVYDRVYGRASKLQATSFFEIPKSHQGTARNFGVQHAHSPYILFGQDDILLEPDACERHLHAHRSRTTHNAQRTTVLGFVTWDPLCEITPVMRFLEKSGWQFGYPMIKRYAHRFLPTKMQQRFTYTSHISLPTEIARKFKFREDVSLYGWEDIEWGERLKNAGVRLYFEPDSKALHHHHITLEQSLARMETLGMSLVHMASLSPGFKVKLARWRLAITHLRSLTPTMGARHTRAFLRGIHKGKKEFSNQRSNEITK